LAAQETFGVQNRIEELQYLYRHDQIEAPYDEQFQQFDISIQRELKESVFYVLIEAKSRNTKKEIVLEFIDEIQ
jgi:hypothetical protein